MGAWRCLRLPLASSSLRNLSLLNADSHSVRSNSGLPRVACKLASRAGASRSFWSLAHPPCALPSSRMGVISNEQLAGYLAQERFSQTFVCQVTQRTVSYATSGKEDGIPIALFLPSSNCRLIACLLDGIATSKGLRLVAMERPGSGKTLPCEPKERMELSTTLQTSLLAHLGIERVHLMSHSGGSSYLMHWLSLHSDKLFERPRIALISPWSPTPGFHPLHLIPTPLIAIEHRVIPSLLPVLSVSGRLATNSGSWFSKVGRQLGLPAPKPPRYVKHTARYFESTDELNSHVIGMATKEPCQGMSQEHLMCLSRGAYAKVAGAGREWFVKTVESLDLPRKPVVQIVWGEGDGLISTTARDWLDGFLEKSGKFEEVKIIKMQEERHDDVLFLDEGLGKALDVLAESS